MNQILASVLLGLIEGVTEFLPVSSTGHLLLAEHWLQHKRSDLFNVTIQLGAILAVVVVYRSHLVDLLSGLRSAPQRDEIYKITASFLITGVLGLAARLCGLELPTEVHPVAAALFLGAIVIFLVEWWAARQPVAGKLTWRVAVAVGIAQVVAGAFPGTSRSGAAIVAAVAAGLTDRPKAAQFAFLVGIPTMFAAAGYEFVKCLAKHTPHEPWGELALATAVSGVVGFFAIRWLLKFVAGHNLVPFAVYRIILAVCLWLYLAQG